MQVERFTLEEWMPIAEDVHKTCFAEERSADTNTFDFALLVTKDGVPQCYSTQIELDKFGCYMQHGGTFPSARGTTATHRGYNLIISYLHERYPRLLTKVLNTNLPMLRLAMSAGFIINGIDVFGPNEIFVRLINDKRCA